MPTDIQIGKSPYVVFEVVHKIRQPVKNELSP